MRERSTVENSFKSSINSLLSHRAVFLNFQKGNLIFPESCSYQEISKLYAPLSLYSFFPVSPNRAVAFLRVYPEISIPYELGFLFPNIPEHCVFNYVNEEKINSKRKEYNESKIPLETQRKLLEPLFSRDDTYDFPILNKDREQADLCNSMMLVHNNCGISIIKQKREIEKALEIINTKNIKKIQDF